ncbi:MAG: bifunctional alpha,alpha-trehalose-phosphate synthase (UDP-forming)/trehalose-phosphatase, partial [Bacteroidetes bacterium]|nr:bifunctional alpha,alpha-trehalose-phosphate synthase (UDP-forming)/trehalose-phosphatase [Bacteroidota bacterium]
FTSYNQQNWEVYQQVNQKFLEVLKMIIQPDDIVWVQDYHLMLLPGLLRKAFPKNRIGFFLHIPFPSYEIFRTLPWRKEILNGLLGADLIGFHTYEYMRHFLIAIHKINDIEAKLGKFFHQNHLVQVEAFPMGIDYEKFHKSVPSKKVQQKAKLFKERYGNVKLILSVDRLDYSKGILQRLKAYDMLLSTHPEFQGQITMLVVVVPSRSEVDKYHHLKIEIDEAIGNLNGKYSTMEWAPVHYFYRSFPFSELVSLYHISDIALITPFRDGMNLIAKEYIATKTDGKGVLILSEMAGAANVLKDALIVNPNHINEIVNALIQAINMPLKEQKQRIENMQLHLRENTVQHWAAKFTGMLDRIFLYKKLMEEKELDEQKEYEIFRLLSQASQKLIFLNYDGTLIPFYEKPSDASPGKDIVKLINNISEISGVNLVLLSGRDHITFDHWFGALNVDLIAEYGTWIRENNQWAQSQILRDEWKDEIYSVLNEFMNKTPGSFIEEKSYSLAWHYRSSDSFLADLRMPDLINCLIYPCTKYKLEIIDGNKVIEIKPVGVDKKTVARHWLNKKKWDFVMAIGADRTDEDIFEILPDDAISIRVGRRQTSANHTLRNSDEVIKFLMNLLHNSKEKKKMKVLSFK